MLIWELKTVTEAKPVPVSCDQVFLPGNPALAYGVLCVSDTVVSR